MIDMLTIGEKVQITDEHVMDRYNIPEDNEGVVVESRDHWNNREVRVKDKDGNFRHVQVIEEGVKRL